MANERPIAVTVICVVEWIMTAFSALLGLGLMFGGTLLAAFIPSDIPGLGGALGAMGLVAGIVVLALSAVVAWIVWKLWQLTNWARIVLIVFAVLGLLSFPIGTIINGIILYFLAFNKDVKAAFGA